MDQVKALEKQLQEVPSSEKPTILNKLAYMLQRNDPEQARAYAEQAMALAEAEGLAKEYAVAHKTIGFIHYVQGNQAAALAWTKQAIQLIKAGNYTGEIVTAISNLASIHIEMGDFPQAMTIYMQALDRGEAVGDEDGIAIVNYNISYLYRSMNEWEKAIAYSQKSIPNWEATNHHGLPYAYNGLSEAFLAQGDAINGQFYSEKNLWLTQITGDQHSEALAYKHLGEALRQQGKLQEALAALLKGCQIEDSLSTKIGIVTHYLAVGNLYLQMEAFTEAANYVHKGLELSLSLKDQPETMNCYKALTTLYENQGEYDKALDYYRQYTAVKDELFNEKKHKQLAEMQTRFDSERKEKEAEIYQLKTVALEKEIRQRRRAEAEALRQSEYYQALLQNIPIATHDL